jgi:hypothetical protein
MTIAYFASFGFQELYPFLDLADMPMAAASTAIKRPAPDTLEARNVQLRHFLLLIVAQCMRPAGKPAPNGPPVARPTSVKPLDDC